MSVDDHLGENVSLIYTTHLWWVIETKDQVITLSVMGQKGQYIKHIKRKFMAWMS